MSKVILLNAPPNAGKSVLTEAVLDKYNLVQARCKDKLFTLTMELFNIPPETFWRIYNDRAEKEQANVLFSVPNKDAYNLGKLLDKSELFLSVAYNEQAGKPKTALSCREAMIFVSELICKPLFGQDYFGQCRADIIEDDINYIDDSCFGSYDEIKPLISRVGQGNILLIRIYGRGTFDGDSRSYVPNGLIKNTKDIWNDKGLDKFMSEGESLIKTFMED